MRAPGAGFSRFCFAAIAGGGDFCAFLAGAGRAVRGLVIFFLVWFILTLPCLE
jgi:hypothetical protein